MEYLDYLDTFILQQRRALRYYLGFSGGLFTLGIFVIVLGTIFAGDMKLLIGVAGGFISSTSGFPLRAFLERKERIDIFRMMRDSLRILLSKPEERDSEEARQLKDLIWKRIETTLTG